MGRSESANSPDELTYLPDPGLAGRDFVQGLIAQRGPGEFVIETLGGVFADLTGTGFLLFNRQQPSCAGRQDSSSGAALHGSSSRRCVAFAGISAAHNDSRMRDKCNRLVIAGHTFQDFDGDPSLTGRWIGMLAVDCEPWGRRSYGEGSGGRFSITPMDESGKAGCRIWVDRVGIERGIGECGYRGREWDVERSPRAVGLRLSAVRARRGWSCGDRSPCLKETRS